MNDQIPMPRASLYASSIMAIWFMTQLHSGFQLNGSKEQKEETSHQDGDIGNMACLLAQPQQKLQLNYKITTTQHSQKIKMYGSLAIKELKKSHSSRPRRRGGGAETWRRGTGGSVPMCGG